MKSILKLIFSIIAICLFYGVSAQTNKDNPRKITWSLEDVDGDPLSEDIATISATGVITAKDVATVVVVMTVEQGKDKAVLSSRKTVKIVPSFGDVILTASKSPSYDEDGVLTKRGESLDLTVRLNNEAGGDITSSSDLIEWKLSKADCIKLTPVIGAGGVANTAKIEALDCKECDVDVEAVITNKGATLNSNKKLLKIRFVPTGVEFLNTNSVVLPTFKSTAKLEVKAVHSTTNVGTLPCDVLNMPAVSATGTETTISWSSENAGAATPATQAEKSFASDGHIINLEAACFNKNASNYKVLVKRNKTSLGNELPPIVVTSRLDPTHMNITYSNGQTVFYKNASTDILVDKIYSASDGLDNSCLIQTATANITKVPTSTCLPVNPDSPALVKAGHKYTFTAPCANNPYEYTVKIIPDASSVGAVATEQKITLSVDLKPSGIDIDAPGAVLKGSGDVIALKALVYSNFPATDKSCQIQDCPNVTVGWNNKGEAFGLIAKSATNYTQLPNSAETVGGTIEPSNTSNTIYFFGKNHQMQTDVNVVAIAAKDGKAVVASSPKAMVYNYQPQKVYFFPDNIVLSSNGDSKYVTLKVDYTLPGNAAFDKCEVTSTSSATANLGAVSSSNLSFNVLNFDKINPGGAIVENPLNKALVKATCSEEKSTFLIKISRAGKELSSSNIENEKLKITTNLEVTNALIQLDGKTTDYTINDMGSVPVKLLVYSDAAKDNKCNITDLAASTSKPILNDKWALVSGNGVDVASLGAANTQIFDALVPCLNNNYNVDTQLKVSKVYRYDVAKAVANVNSPLIKARFQPSQETSYLTIAPIDAANNCNTSRSVTPIIYAFTRKGCAVDERTSPSEPFGIVANSTTVYGEAVRTRVTASTKAISFIPLQATSDFATATYEIVINKNGSKNVSLKAPFDIFGVKDYYNAVPTFHSFDAKGQPTFTLKAYKYWVNGCVGSDLDAGFIPENAAIAREVIN